MEVLRFDLMGKMAHFRKYYSNSTALSYHLPPVSTIKGILAGLLGMERDSYYELFSNENCGIAIGIGAPERKITQTMNLLKVEAVRDLNGSSRPAGQIYGANHTQNDTEWLVPENIRTGFLRYCVCVWHRDRDTLLKLVDKLCRFPAGYGSEGISLALGSAQCLGWIENARLADASAVELAQITTRYAVPASLVKGVTDRRCFSFLMKEESITELHNLAVTKKETVRTITEHSKQEIILSGSGQSVTFLLKAPARFWQCEDEAFFFLGGQP